MTKNPMRNAAFEESLSIVLKGPKDDLDQLFTNI